MDNNSASEQELNQVLIEEKVSKIVPGLVAIIGASSAPLWLPCP